MQPQLLPPFILLLLLGFAPHLLAQSPAEMTPDDRFELFSGDVPPEFGDGDRTIAPPITAPATSDHALKTNACASAFNLNAPYNTNNGQRGCMFDLTAANTLTINCFDANLYAGTTANYEIYYRAGTHVGFENNAAAWTFLGGETGVTSAGNNLPTALNIPINVTIPAGQTYSFYITNDFGGGTSYTDGTAVGTLLAADANLTIFEGLGKSYPFGLTFNVRNFNGTIFYDLGGGLADEDIALTGTSTDQGNLLNWSLANDPGLEKVSLQRSGDGLRFTDIAEFSPGGSGSYLDRFSSELTGQFYRLVLTRPDGEKSYSEVIEINAEANLRPFTLGSASPNPFSSNLSLDITNHRLESLEVKIFDQMGRKVHAETAPLQPGKNPLQLDLARLKPGVYMVQCSGGGSRQSLRIVRQ